MRSVVLLGVSLLLACSGGPARSEPQEDDAGASDAASGADAGPDAAPCEPSTLATRSPELFEAIMSRSIADEPIEDGNYEHDFGDATAYAPPVLHAMAAARCDSELAALAEETLDWEKELVSSFDGSPDPEAIIGALALTETYRLGPREDLKETAAQILTYLHALLDLVEGYLPRLLLGDLPYGQTAATALIVIVGLRYAEVVDPDDAENLERSLQAIDDIAAEAWLEDLGAYQHNQGDDRLELYPNVAMMAAHTLAYRTSGDPAHLARAEELFDVIQDLFLPELGAYHSTYTSDAPDYVTLSSTNYLQMALRFLYEETGDVRYAETADTVFEFIETFLWDPETRIAYHDWENGDRAVWYCAGCQHQLAYTLLLYGE